MTLEKVMVKQKQKMATVQLAVVCEAKAGRDARIGSVAPLRHALPAASAPFALSLHCCPPGDHHCRSCVSLNERGSLNLIVHHLQSLAPLLLVALRLAACSVEIWAGALESLFAARAGTRTHSFVKAYGTQQAPSCPVTSERREMTAAVRNKHTGRALWTQRTSVRACGDTCMKQHKL